MPKKPQHGEMQGASERQPRAATLFQQTPKFLNALNAIKPPPYGRVLASIQLFERLWKASVTNEDIPPGYTYKSIENVPGRYQLYQIYVIKDYRAIMMSINGTNDTYWLYVWKKHGQNDREEIKRAKSLAEVWWKQLHS